MAVRASSATATGGNFNAPITTSAGTADATTYTLGSYAFGGNSHASQLIGQTTTGVSTATTICTVAGDGALLIVSGSDGTNKFSDTIMANLATVNTIGSGTAAGAPAVRTYSSGGAGVVRLAMASGTYNVAVFGLVGGQR